MENIKFEVVDKISKNLFKSQNLKKISRFESISPPSVFIGSKLHYPQVNVGILSPLEKEENAWVYDDSKYWADNDFSINDVIKLRSSLLNSRFKSNVQDVSSNKKFVEIAKDIAVAYKPVDVEIELKNSIAGGRKSDRVLTPHGMKAGLKNAKVTSNVKIHQKVDRMINDEVKSTESLSYLYKNKFDVYSLSKILSVGVLGLKKNKRMVPTRWSITATDDTIGKDLIKRVRQYPLINDYHLFFGEFLGNQFLIMLFPGVWSYELFELYYPGSSWNPGTEMKASTDIENYDGRKSYASNTAGGYYASRFPIAELLDNMKRQASVIVIRLETPSYWAALGVWVVRESVQKALAKGGMKFDSKEEFLDAVKKVGKIKYGFDSTVILNNSKLLRGINEQKRLREWF
jgi:DNA repair protein NreA